MNKKMAVALTVSTFLLTANVTASVLAADNVSDQSGVKVSVDGMFNSERREFSKRSEDDRSKRYWNDTGKDRAYGSYVFDLKLSKEFKNDGEIVLHLNGSEASDSELAAVPICRCEELFYKQSYFNKSLT